MKRQWLFLLLFTATLTLSAQERVFPLVKDYGGIFDIPSATMKPDPTQVYKIVVDVYTGAKEPTELASGLNNVARMLNLHVVGGVPPGKLDVVLAIHGGATFSVLDNDSYRKKHGVDNPNIGLIKALKDAGVRLTVCGQSLLGREIPLSAVNPDVEVATSMLTTVSTYQLKGYAVFKF
ncbi:DsrE family protein [Neolewinella agarilytica]|uniref:Intracellular sulfur oxidation protein, DsrE/DsrF family n=1 Tax=Neolewinella agarilytica TaxID=478744 RepID=A0A1H9GR29_9BACT|nr:DsrE family protein [Neolewinella agarilytica]SEQ52531.1 Intracellular sulfur oxidation protein, DsrE/DsrF family [Neolewinella agarilytica]